MRRLQQKWCSIAVSSALVAMVGAAQATTLENGPVAKSASPALQAFESAGRMPYIVGFRDAPAVTYKAQLKAAPTVPLRGKMAVDVDASVAAYATQLEGR